jgi:hypothetical protein
MILLPQKKKEEKRLLSTQSPLKIKKRVKHSFEGFSMYLVYTNEI